MPSTRDWQRTIRVAVPFVSLVRILNSVAIAHIVHKRITNIRIISVQCAYNVPTICNKLEMVGKQYQAISLIFSILYFHSFPLCSNEVVFPAPLKPADYQRVFCFPTSHRPPASASASCTQLMHTPRAPKGPFSCSNLPKTGTRAPEGPFRARTHQNRGLVHQKGLFRARTHQNRGLVHRQGCCQVSQVL